MEKLSGIYLITSAITGRVYVGSSKSIDERLKRHFFELRNNKHPNVKLQNHFNKYGESDLVTSILEYVVEDDLYKTEQKYIDKFNKKILFNISLVVNSGGGDSTGKEVYLLDLDGKILSRFSSGLELTRSLGKNRMDYKRINTSSVFYRKYRIVTPDYYHKNQNKIKSWKNYTSESVEKSRKYKKNKYKITTGGVSYKSNTITGISKHVDCCKETIRLQVKQMIDLNISKKYFNKHPNNNNDYIIELINE